jgi:hypothetical protein
MESNDKLEQMLKQMYAQETLRDDKIDTSDIIDEEWTKFETEHFASDQRSNSLLFTFHSLLTKIAAMLTFGRACSRSEEQMQASLSSRLVASFVGVLLLGGIAFATIHIISSGSQKADEVQTIATENSQISTLKSQLAEQDSALYKPIVYESAELATILDEIATFYEVEPVYKNEATKHIRLYFTWDKKRSLDDIIDTFNKFERINMTRYDKILIVE